MAGVAFYNKFIPVKPFEYFAMPLYSFGTKSLAGSADAAYTFYPGKTFQHISLSGSLSHYSYNRFKNDGADDAFSFTRISPSLNFEFKKETARSPVSESLKLESIHILQEEPEYALLRTTSSCIIIISTGPLSASIAEPPWIRMDYLSWRSRAINL